MEEDNEEESTTATGNKEQNNTTAGTIGENAEEDGTPAHSCCLHKDNDSKSRLKVERKAAKKAMKAARRAQREGRGSPTAGQKCCDMCTKSVDLLIRCKHSGSMGRWEMVCGLCWNDASGGVVDGDKKHPDYQYGGLWKNRRKI